MGFCSRRYFFLSLCLIQTLSVVERQVFDFLGFLWIPILVNFFEIVFIIFGFFGAYQYRPKYIISNVLWHLFWLAWNVFLICLYLDVADLDHKSNKVLKLDESSESWWAKAGPGCRPYLVNVTEKIDHCFVDYVHVEVFQAGLQSVLSVVNVIFGLCLCRSFLEEDDTFDYSDQKRPEHISLHPTYERDGNYFLSSNVNYRKKPNKVPKSNIGDIVRYSGSSYENIATLKPLTSMRPRSMYCNSAASRKSRKNPKRMSLYSIEFSSQLESRAGDSDSGDGDAELAAPVSPKPMTPRRVKRRSVMTRGSSGRRSSGSRRARASRRMAQNPVTRLLEQQQGQKAAPPAYCSASQASLVAQAQPPWRGHSNPTYQQSSTQSLNDPEDFDDLYNNRPASVRSSYSNFHGTRAISYATQPKHYQHSHATPQVPLKRSLNAGGRSSMRSMAFLNNGPPAYSTAQAHTSIDSETTI